MKKILLAVFLCGLFALSTRAQVANYTFSQTTTTYTEITGGTVLGSATTDEERFLDPAVPLGSTTATTGPGLPIGFNFVYNGTTYNVFGVNANGWICFGQDTLTPNPINMASTSYILPLSTGSTAPAVLQDRVSIFGRNIAAQTGSELSYATLGTTPNQVLVVQWKNYRRNGQNGEDFHFQIRLYETTNVIEFIYDTLTLNTTPATAPQVGLRGSANTDFNNRTSTTSWTATTAGLANNATIAISQTIFPPLGLVFRWTPPMPNDAGITVISTPGSVAPLGVSNVNVTIRNYGSQDLTDATIAWKVDGVLQTPYTYTNAGLAQGATDGPILIGTCNLLTTGSHTITAWTESPNGVADQNHGNDTCTKIVYVQSYGSIPYYQSFDAVWINKLNTQDVPDQFWINTPVTGNNSWRREDDSVSAAWTTAGGLFNPNAADGSAHAARFHTRGSTNGLTGTLDLYLNFSPVGVKQLKFWHINTGGTDSLSVSMSEDGGSTFTLLQKIATNTVWNEYQIILGDTVSPNVVLRFMARSNGGQSDIGLDQVSVTLLSPNDAGVLSIDAPLGTVYGLTPVDVTVKNFGTDSLQSANIQWSVNGAMQTPFSYTNVPGVPFNSTDGPVNIGTYNFITGGFYTIRAWTTAPNGLSDGDHANDTAVRTVYVQEYAAIPFLEDFEGGWIDKYDVREVPTLFWTNTPLDGNQSWRRDDDGVAAGWTQATQGPYAPTGANGTSHSARFHTWYATADSMGMMDLYIDFSPAGQKVLKFWYINPSGVDSLSVLISSDSAASFTFLQSMVVDTAWKQYTIPLGTSTSTGTVIRFLATSDYGNDDIGLDRVEVYIPVANDVGISSIISPKSSLCGSANDSVIVVVSNYGTDSQTNIPVKVDIFGPGGFFSLYASLPGPLASNESDTLFVGTTNTSVPGTYDITAYTYLGTDAVHMNDTVDATILIDVALPVPHVEDFENATPLANWNTNFTSGNGHGNTSFVMYRSLSNANPTGTAVSSKKYGPITSTVVYGFDYRVVSTTMGNNGVPLVTDSIFAYLSGDCGATNDLVYLITAANHTTSNVMKHISVPLTSYIGMDVIPSFFVKRGNTVNYYLDIDNVAIYELPVADAGPDLSVCYLDTLDIVSASATDYTSVFWTTAGDGSFIDDQLLNPQYVLGANDISNGTVDLTLFVIGTYGDTVSSTITVTVTTSASADAGSDVSICEGSYTQLLAIGGSNCVWVPPTGLSSTSVPNPMASPAVTTTYTVTITSSCGTASDDVTVTVIPFTLPDLGNDTILCAGTSITLDAGSGYGSYSWSPIMSGAQTINIDTADIGLVPTEIFVTVTSGICSATDSVMITFIDCSGIPEISDNASIEVYPNPTTGMLNVVLTGVSANSSLSIYDLHGQVVYSKTLAQQSEAQLDLSGLQSGIYLLRVESSEVYLLKKVIIQ